MSERVTFGVDAANSLLRLDRPVLDRDGDKVFGPHPTLRGHFAPYTLTSDEPLTAEQTKAVCVAEPGLCFMLSQKDGGTTIRRYHREYGWQSFVWGRWSSSCGPLGGLHFNLVPNPEATHEATETRGEIKLPRTTTSLVEAAQHFEAGGVVEDKGGILWRKRHSGAEAMFGGKWCIPQVASLSLSGTYTLHPADHLDKPKPKVGAELRRWMVAHPGRVVLVAFEGGTRCHWCELDARFKDSTTGVYVQIHNPDTGTPETGTWGD